MKSSLQRPNLAALSYASVAWCANLNKKSKITPTSRQNKFICFYLTLVYRSHFHLEKIEKKNLLPMLKTLEQCVSYSTFKYVDNNTWSITYLLSFIYS